MNVVAKEKPFRFWKSNHYHLAWNYLLLSELLQLILNKILHSDNPLNTKLNPICHLLALLGAHPIFHVSRIRVKVCCAFLPTHTFTHKFTLTNIKIHTSYAHPSTVHLHNPPSNKAIFPFPSQSSKWTFSPPV